MHILLRGIKMSMKHTSKRLTVCEVVRQLNDIHQSDSDHDKTVREKLAEIECMSKRMVQKLMEYKEKKSVLFPDSNTEYSEKVKLRKSKKYKVEK